MPAAPATSVVFENRFVLVLLVRAMLTENVLFVRPFATVREIGTARLELVVVPPRSGTTLNCCPVLARYWTCALKLIVRPRPRPPGPPRPPPPPPPPPPRPPPPPAP